MIIIIMIIIIIIIVIVIVLVVPFRGAKRFPRKGVRTSIIMRA